MIAKEAQQAARFMNAVAALGPRRAPRAFEAAAVQCLGPIVQLVEAPSSLLHPNHIATLHDGNLVGVWARGVETYLQAASYLAGALVSTPLHPGVPNSSCTSYATRLAGLVAQLPRNGLTKYAFAGHSFGAAALTVLASAQVGLNPNFNFTLYDCGSPKPGQYGSVLAIGPPYSRRWVTEGDPIPTLPPDPSYALLAASLAGPIAAAAWAFQSHATDAFVVSSAGTVTASGAQQPLGILAVGDLAALLLSSVLNRNSLHHVSYYVAFLGTASQRVQPDFPGPSVIGSGPDVGTGPGDATVKVGSVPPVLPPSKDRVMATVVRPVEDTPYVAPLGGLWAIVWENYVLDNYRTQKDAQRALKYLKHFLVREQFSAVQTSPQGWANAVALYMGRLTQVGTGFEPVTDPIPATVVSNS